MDKRIIIIIRTTLIIFFMALPVKMISQAGLPEGKLYSTDGKIYSLKELGDSNMVTVLVFWATWCKPCIEELDNIADYYSEWSDQADFKFVSICIDDSRTSSTVKSFVMGRNWPFPVLMDENQDMKRTLSVTDIPFYCLYNKNGKIVKRHTGYLPGDEEFMFEEILKYSNEK